MIADNTLCVCLCLCLRVRVCSSSSTVGPPEGPHGQAVARAGAKEKEARETKGGSQRDGERPDQTTAGEIQLSCTNSLCELESVKFFFPSP